MLDSLTVKRDADELVKRIQHYWDAKGVPVKVWAQLDDSSCENKVVWNIRSNMINGLPQRGR